MIKHLRLAWCFIFISCGGPSTNLRQQPPVCGNGEIEPGEACDFAMDFEATCPDDFAMCLTCVGDCTWQLRDEPYEPTKPDLVPYCSVTFFPNTSMRDSYERQYDDKGQLLLDRVAQWGDDSVITMKAETDTVGNIVQYLFEECVPDQERDFKCNRSKVSSVDRHSTWNGIEEIYGENPEGPFCSDPSAPRDEYGDRERCFGELDNRCLDTLAASAPKRRLLGNTRVPK